MKKILHIISTPREEESRTLSISESFLHAFQSHHTDWIVDELNLFKESLPPLTVKRVDGKYLLLEGKELFGELREGWREILVHIDRFLSADAYMISAPMWNFSIPYMLKHYLDIIIQPNYLFKYTSTGTEGLVKNKKMIVLASFGGEYLSEQTRPQNFYEPYIRMVFEFIGIKDIHFIIAQPTDKGKELEKQKVNEAMQAAEQYAASF